MKLLYKVVLPEHLALGRVVLLGRVALLVAQWQPALRAQVISAHPASSKALNYTLRMNYELKIHLKRPAPARHKD